MRLLFVVCSILASFSSVLLSQSEQLIEPSGTKPIITFIELGSVNCIPCKKMQPVMKAVEQKYGRRVNVVFYDVWTEAQKPFAKKYNIRLIPTQIFLDDQGKEFFRHEGFFPEEEIHKIFKQRGVLPVRSGG